MRDFFRGWKRKIGVVTLLMACILSSFWIRSQAVEDALISPITNVRIESTTGRLRIGIFHSVPGSWFSWPDWRSRSVAAPLNYPWSNWQLGLVHGTNIRSKSDPRDLLIIAPYWLLVVPLTALSAYLLISKPRVRTPVSENQPV
ncbi:hypothetical protein [Schlesneria paludicola]|uniref:hypothetical protein n=1 Tax=Schlesneria paludicola TaxID=360056 RepID=UPI0012FC3F7A|nr:hypothetical protein [Schlesneria paludicola]